jgi:hypothetical protein
MRSTGRRGPNFNPVLWSVISLWHSVPIRVISVIRGFINSVVAQPLWVIRGQI